MGRVLPYAYVTLRYMRTLKTWPSQSLLSAGSFPVRLWGNLGQRSIVRAVYSRDHARSSQFYSTAIFFPRSLRAGTGQRGKYCTFSAHVSCHQRQETHVDRPVSVCIDSRVGHPTYEYCPSEDAWHWRVLPPASVGGSCLLELHCRYCCVCLVLMGLP